MPSFPCRHRHGPVQPRRLRDEHRPPRPVDASGGPRRRGGSRSRRRSRRASPRAPRSATPTRPGATSTWACGTSASGWDVAILFEWFKQNGRAMREIFSGAADSADRPRDASAHGVSSADDLRLAMTAGSPPRILDGIARGRDCRMSRRPHCGRHLADSRRRGHHVVRPAFAAVDPGGPTALKVASSTPRRSLMATSRETGRATLCAKLPGSLPRARSGRGDGVFHERWSGGPADRRDCPRNGARSTRPTRTCPYHQRIDRGFVRFVNNDHCLLSTRASLFLPAYVAPELAYMPMAQTVWYVPTALDPWSQLLGEAPGTTGAGRGRAARRPRFRCRRRIDRMRRRFISTGRTKIASITGSRSSSRARSRRPIASFLGLFEERERRRELFAQLAFAGLIDGAGSDAHNRSPTPPATSPIAPGPPSSSAPASVGWTRARDVILCRGSRRMARWGHRCTRTTMACQVSWIHLADDTHRNRSSLGPGPSEACEERLLANRETAHPERGARADRGLTPGPRAGVHRRDHRAPARQQGIPASSTPCSSPSRTSCSRRGRPLSSR